MDYYRNILITGCSSGLGQALFNRVWEDDTLTPFAHYRSEHGDPHALIGDITDPDFQRNWIIILENVRLIVSSIMLVFIKEIS